MRLIICVNRTLFALLALASLAVVYLSVALILFGPGKPKVVMCYYASWAAYRRGGGRFTEAEIDPFLCTHLVYAFAGLDPESLTVTSLDEHRDLGGFQGQMQGFARVNSLKKVNPDLATLLAVGGWDEGSAKFSRMAAEEGSRRAFAEGAAKLLQRHGFDGMDLDWEFPGDLDRGGHANDSANFSLLLRDLRATFDLHGLLLTSAVAASPEKAEAAYGEAFQDMAECLDLVSVMTYDYHGWFGPPAARGGGGDLFTGHNAPLFSEPGKSNSAQRSVDYWVRKGIPQHKIILGIPAYGRGFTIKLPEEIPEEQVSRAKELQVLGPSRPGASTMTPGLLGLNELCEQMSSGKEWKFFWDPEASVPYALSVSTREWLSFEDALSAAAKAAFAADRGLGGVMVWTMDTDDFSGSCGEGRFPVTAAASEGVNPGMATTRRRRRTGEF